MNWREHVLEPDSFDYKERNILDGVPDIYFGILLGEATASTKEEKEMFAHCTKAVPITEIHKALHKFYHQSKGYKKSKKRMAEGHKVDDSKIDYDKLATGSGHGDKKTRLINQKLDRWGDPYL